MKKLLLLSLLLLSLISCSINKKKSAHSIYYSIKPTKISMSASEEKERMKGVVGCYGLVLGQTTKKEAIKKLYPLKAIAQSLHYKTTITDEYVPDEYMKIPNINVLLWQKKDSDNEINITSIFVNDTLVQEVIEYWGCDASNLKQKLIEKYGEGNGEYKEGVFGVDKNGELNFSDYCAGYEYREWQNENISICYGEEQYICNLTNNKYILSSGIHKAVYTSKSKAQRLIYYLDKAYNEMISLKKTEKQNELNNL